MSIRKPIPFARKIPATQSAGQELAALKLPDRLHSLSNHVGQSHGAPRDLRLSNRRISIRHDLSDDGGSTLLKYRANSMMRSTNHQLRYAAKAHPLGGVTARESAAKLEFESDAEACSLGQGVKKRQLRARPVAWILAMSTARSKANVK